MCFKKQVSNLSKGEVLFLVACADKGTFSHLAWVDRTAGVFAKKREERENAWKIMGPREIGKKEEKNVSGKEDEGSKLGQFLFSK